MTYANPSPHVGEPAVPATQLVTADGQVELAPGAYPTDSAYANDDLKPVPVAERHWTTYNFAALCGAWEQPQTLHSVAPDLHRPRLPGPCSYSARNFKERRMKRS